ncbi:EndoU domain-containing protein [Vallitalea guaymasensis]|uniref:EndoU domain-containing protein n=2 Tax=Vallitalea guaymasensis TaxID=1185412 RepID=A0A8J8SBX1_9FIRM|nr:EndoU domain-containing protein [Vallitalea guaymasensis]
MGNMSIKTRDFGKNEHTLRRCSNNISEIEDSFRSLKYSLDSDIKYRDSIGSEMLYIQKDLDKIARNLYELSDFVRNTKNQYEKTERELECLVCNLNNMTQHNKIENDNNNDNPILKGFNFLSKIGLFGIFGGLFTTIKNLSDFFSSKKVINNTDNYKYISYNKFDYEKTVKFLDFDGLVLEKNIYQGKVAEEIKSKDIIGLKKSLENILKNYKGFEVDLTDHNGNYNSNIDEDLDEAVYKFLLGFEEYHSGNNLIFTYEALPKEYKLKTLLHWVNMTENDYSTFEFVANLLPEEYYENIPPIPLKDDELGIITNENKYESSAAYEYYAKYYYPLDALNEINHWNFPEEVKRNNFYTWARLTYGSSAKEQGQEFRVGLFWGISVAPLKTVIDTIEGIYSIIKDPAQLKVFAAFMAKAIVYEEYRDALKMMITQAIEEWKNTYNEAEPFDKGCMIGSLIGEVLCAAIEGGETAASIVKFVKSGGFKKAIKGVMQTTKRLNKIIAAKLDELPDLIRSITRTKEYFEVVTPEGIIYRIDIDDLPDEKIKKFNKLVNGTSNLFSKKSLTHLTDKVEFFSKRNGVSGGHNYDMFKKYFDDVQMPYKEVKKTSHSGIDGIYDIEYKVGAKNYQGVYEADKWTSTTYKKTVYDPSKISNDDIIKWAGEALNDVTPIVTDGGQKYVKGTALNGLKFEGWVDDATGEIKSFYPVFDWNK